MQSVELCEDLSTAVVEQQNAEVLTQIGIPQCVLVVEKAQVTDDTIHRIVCGERETGSRGQRSLDAVDATIAVDMLPGIETAQSHRRAVGVVQGEAFRGMAEPFLKEFHGLQIGVARDERPAVILCFPAQRFPAVEPLARSLRCDGGKHVVGPCLYDAVQVHHRVVDSAVGIHLPADSVLSLSQELLGTLADQCVADVEDEVGQEILVVLCHS